MNSFDVVVYVGLIVAMVIGFRAGLLAQRRDHPGLSAGHADRRLRSPG